MRIVDVNVLLYAVNKNDSRHRVVRQWWEQSLCSDEPIGLAWIVLIGYLRISTNRHAFAQPQTPQEAVAKVTTWLTHANTRLIRESENHWGILAQLVEETGTTGNLTTDAHLAALAISRGATLVSCDQDFSRFRQLRWENPLD